MFAAVNEKKAKRGAFKKTLNTEQARVSKKELKRKLDTILCE